MELSLLDAIQKLSNPLLDQIMTIVSAWGNRGMIWIIITLLLLCKKDYRKAGIVCALSLFFALGIGNGLLKNIFARQRPCWMNDSVTLLVSRPRDYSFPSGHTFSSFAAAASIYLYHPKIGACALVLASLIGFSRLYLYVHYPTDVLGGALFGIATAYLISRLCNRYIVM